MNTIRRKLIKQGNSRALIISSAWREILGWSDDQSLICSFDGSSLKLSKPGVVIEPEAVVETPSPRRRRRSRAKEIVSAYITHCSALLGEVKVSRGLPSSETIKTVVKAADKREKGRDWDEYFKRVAASDWLTGKKSSFRADLPWLLSPKAVAALDCGRYDNRDKNSVKSFSETDFDAF